MDQPTLFELPPEQERPAENPPPGTPRLRKANRQQVVMRALALDEMVPPNDEVRVVWAFVEKADLSALYSCIRAVEGVAGRNATDPRIFMALWLFATLKGVGAARELERLCKQHLQYQWLCGDVSMNYHTLSNFRVDHADVLDDLLTEQIAGLMSIGVVKLERVAQDGVRVRASAGKASFRRQEKLDICLVQARQQVDTLKREVHEDPAAASRREKAACERAARERLENVQKALVACEQVQAMKDKRGGDSLKNPARASTTDPDARNMKMPNGGFNPAFNVQFATDTQSQVITGVDVTNQGTDAGQLAPMVEQIEERTGVRPQNVLADGGFSTKGDIEALNDPEHGYKVYAPVKEAEQQRTKGQDPFAARQGESARLTEWRVRMGTEEAKTIYKERAATAECVNALARNRGLQQFRVRGLTKVRTIALWFAIAHNLRRWAVLRAEVAASTAKR